MIYFIVIGLVIVPMIIFFAFFMAMLKHLSKISKNSIVIRIKIWKLLDIRIHIEPKRTTYNKKKNK